MTSVIPTLINLTGQRALITGASGGIGRATAILFRELGASVIAVSRDKQKLKSLERECEKYETAGFIHTVSADITKVEDVKRIYQKVQSSFGMEFEILVNNADSVETGTKEELVGHHNLCSRSTVYLIITAGTIISSVNGIKPYLEVEYNNRGQFVQDGMSIADMINNFGGRINYVATGVSSSTLYRPDGMSDAEYEMSLKSHKKYHEKEVANVIGFLASDASSIVSGVTIPVFL